MDESRRKWRVLRSTTITMLHFLIALAMVSAERSLKLQASGYDESEQPGTSNHLLKAVNFLWQPDSSGYQHVWPDMKFGWQIVVGSIIGFCGAAFGSVV